jgi:VIT1/CCC1 family predicted Fe2+/Mn2+ transporter
VIVFLWTFPVALPFALMQDAVRALRWSNAIAVIMMMGAGATYARSIGRSPWLGGVAMVALGAVLVSMTMALGG